MLLTGDYLIKYASTCICYVKYLVMASIIWCLSIPGWFYVVKDHREAIIGALFAVFSLIGTTLIGIIGFDEKLNNYEWLGLGLAIISACLLGNKI